MSSNTLITKIKDNISEQAWFQEGKNKWDELDQQSKTYTIIGISALGLILFLYFIISTVSSVYSTRDKYQQKAELIALLQNSNQQISSYRSSSASTESNSKELKPYFTQSASRLGIDGANLTISNARAGKDSESSEESLYDINLKGTNIRKAVQYAISLETGNIPVKLRHFKMTTNSPEGFVDASLSVSAFSLKGDQQ